MPKPRKNQICLEATPYYHCISRCVRQAYLCGTDKFSNKNYNHRRKWIEQRIHLLAQVFCIDICSYAVMHNHTHLVLHVNSEQMQTFSDVEIIERWQKIFKVPDVIQWYLNPTTRKNLDGDQLNTAQSYISAYRERLTDISWFMRSLNEYIARRANKEDKCKGRFWEGRFKCQPLLDEAAVAACMVYNDLNPVKAGIADTPESSDHTSIKARISAQQQNQQPRTLMPFTESNKSEPAIIQTLPFTLEAYLDLLQSTFISLYDTNATEHLSNCEFAQSLSIDSKDWMNLVNNFSSLFSNAVGHPSAIRSFQQRTGAKRSNDIKTATMIFK